MVRDGIPFVGIPILLAVVPALFGYWLLSLPLLLVAGFMAFFFRDPRRTPPQEQGIVVAPADGRVTIVRQADDEHAQSLVSIFLSPLDVHINRAPIAGQISEIVYKTGKFHMATRDDSRLLNEQNSLTIQANGLTVGCIQIAGILARRIVCWKKEGDRVECGERFGMIKFGSRTDLLLPPTVELLVQVGMHVRGGETIVGRIRK
jgi:phosphatidylserine decarboxylase